MDEAELERIMRSVFAVNQPSVAYAANGQIHATREFLDHQKKWAHPLNIHQLFADGFANKLERQP